MECVVVILRPGCCSTVKQAYLHPLTIRHPILVPFYYFFYYFLINFGPKRKKKIHLHMAGSSCFRRWLEFHGDYELPASGYLLQISLQLQSIFGDARANIILHGSNLLEMLTGFFQIEILYKFFVTSQFNVIGANYKILCKKMK